MEFVLKVLLVLFLPQNPKAASVWAADIVEYPGAARILQETCWRESRCKPVGPHKIDLWAGDKMWERAVKVGWLRPQTCPWHRKEAVDTWAPSGPWGASRAYTLRHLAPFDCVPARVLDHPVIGALANALRMKRLCHEKRACDSLSVREYWRGKGNVEAERKRLAEEEKYVAIQTREI